MDYWNRNFTDLIRRTHSARWGNWSLDMDIRPGAVGVIDPTSGTFRLVKNVLPNLEKSDVIESAHNSDWDMMTSHVSRTESDIDLEGSGTDPETGVKGSAGLKVTWSMERTGAIVSQCSMVSQSTLNNTDETLMKHLGWLKEQAEDAGMGNDRGIMQGFGVVTSVLYAQSGVNVASKADNNAFSITGTASGVHKLLGEASGKGSYSSTSATKSVDKHIWPSESGELAPHPFPIAYTFASFDGDLLFPTWIEPIGSFELYIDNNHGGTYIVKANLSFMVDGKKETRSKSVSGGLTGSIGSIPVKATNLELKLEFVCVGSNEVKTFKWGNPRSEWLTGVRHIDIFGVWPGKTQAKVRETGETR